MKLNLKKDLDSARTILNLFHTVDITDENLLKICNQKSIHGRIKGYGFVDIVIDDGFDPSYLSGEVAFSTFEKLAPNLKFRAFTTLLDSNRNLSNITNISDSIHEFLISKGYRTLNAQEWFIKYYEI